MAPKTKLEKAQYYRSLELISIIAEEWGEAIKEINDYNWKGKDIKNLENAIKELDQMYSPMFELTGMLEVMIKQKRNGETEKES